MAAGAALVSLACLFVLSPAVYAAWDYTQLHALYREYSRRALLAGRLPLWNPHANLGRPFLGDLEAAFWYPPNLLFVALPARVALAAVLGLHFGLIFLGTRALGRYLGMNSAAAALAALAFTAGGSVTSRLLVGHFHFVQGMSYLPLLLWLTARVQDEAPPRRVACLAVALCLQLLTGHPQIAWVTWLGLTAFLVGRRVSARWGRFLRDIARDAAAFGAALLAAFALAAIQLLPFAELIRHGNRPPRTFEFAASDALSGRGASSLVLPPTQGSFVSWEFNSYNGSLIVLAGTAGLSLLRDRNMRGLALSAVLTGVLALGQATPAFAVAYHLVPGVSAFRLHARLVVWTSFALCMAAGVFLSRRGTAAGAHPRRVAMAVAGALAAAVCLAARCLVTPWPARLALTLTGGATVLAVWRTVPVPAVMLAAIVASSADVLSSGLDLRRIYRHLSAPSIVERETTERLARAGLLQPGLPPPRTSLPLSQARPNSGMIHGYSTYTGYAGVAPARSYAYAHRALGLPLPLGAGTFVMPEVAARGPFPFSSMNLVLGFDPAAGRLRRARRPDPRAFLAFRTLRVPDWTAALERVAAGHDEARIALVEDRELDLPEPSSAGIGAAPSTEGTAEVVYFSPEAIRVRVEGPRRAVLVLKEAWYPGWTARVDGAPAPCRPANVWARAVPVPAGSHEVEFSYRSTWLRAGALITVVAALALGALWRAGAGGASPGDPVGTA